MKFDSKYTYLVKKKLHGYNDNHLNEDFLKQFL